MIQQSLRVTVLAAGIVGLAALPSGAVVHTVTVGNNFFSPLKTTVNPGDTVRWIWDGGLPHSTTSDLTSPKQWSSPTTSTPGFTYDVQFTLADGTGPFPYHCEVHAVTMKDTIFVAGPQSCCDNRVGDANAQGGDEPTISDISVLIDAKFITGTCNGVIGCTLEADINQSGGANPTCADITIGDISVLIDYLFITGPTLGLPDCL